MESSPLDLRCYVVTAAGNSKDILRVARESALGGAGVIQVRSKPIEARDLFSLAAQVAEAVSEANPSTRVLIDDRVDVALALRAKGLPVHGVHLGQADLPVDTARELLGPNAIIGLTTGTAALVRSTNGLAPYIDYIGAGPFRPTPTKDSGRRPIGLEGYPALARLSNLPIVAIGDIQPADVSALAATGVAGVAMVRSFHTAQDPAEVARTVIADFEAANNA